MNEKNMSKSLLEQFDAAYGNVTADRRDIYGDPQDTYRRISAMRSVVDECPDPHIRDLSRRTAPAGSFAGGYGGEHTDLGSGSGPPLMR
jgi:hypothetical protein